MSVPEATSAYLESRHPAELELALWAREIVLEGEPDLDERVYPGWDGIGFRHPEAGYVCGVFPREGEVRLLFEHGVRLGDPDQLLEGDGSQTRHVTLKAADDRLRVSLADLVAEAVAQRLFGT